MSVNPHIVARIRSLLLQHERLTDNMQASPMDWENWQRGCVDLITMYGHELLITLERRQS